MTYRLECACGTKLTVDIPSGGWDMLRAVFAAWLEQHQHCGDKVLTAP